MEDDPRDAELTVHALQRYIVTNCIHVACKGAGALEYIFATGSYANRDVKGGPAQAF